MQKLKRRSKRETDDFTSAASPVLTHSGHVQKQEAADLTHKEALEVTRALPVPQGIWEI